MKHKTFTLIEILTVMVILAILAGISIGVVGLVNRKNAETQTMATIKILELALGQLKNETGSFYLYSSPVKEKNLTIPKDIPASVKGTLYQYLEAKVINSSTKVDGVNRYFIDGWGNPLVYRVPGKFNKTGFDLGSKGPDGKYGDGSSNYDDFGKGDDVVNFTPND